MRSLRAARLYALAILAVILVGGMVLRPGSGSRQAAKSPAPPAERIVTAGL